MIDNDKEQKSFFKWVLYQIRRTKNPRLAIERFLTGNSLNQIIAAVMLFIVVFLAVCWWGYDGNWKQAFADMASPVSVRNAAYNSPKIIADPTGTASVTIDTTETKTVRDLIWVYMLGTIVLSGLVIATITNTVRTWGDRFKQGSGWYWIFSRHVVFLGYDDMVPGMIERICGSRLYPNRIRIVVGVKKGVQEVTTQLGNHLSNRQRKCVVVLQADGCNQRDLRRLKARSAKEVYIIGEHDDAYNLNSYERIQEMCGENHHPECYVQMQYQSTFALFQTYSKEDMAHFHAFNFHDEWARLMVTGKYLPKDMLIDYRGEGTEIGPNSGKHVHLLIFGMTEMGEALAREVAFLCHYPNYVTKGMRTKITFIDPHAEEQKTYFEGRFHHLFSLCHSSYYKGGEKPVNQTLEKDFLDIEFEFIQADIAESVIQKQIAEWAADETQLLTIAVCADSPQRSMAAGLFLPDAVFDNNIPIWVYQPAKGDMGKYLGGSRFKNVTTFGMSGRELDIKNEEIIRQAKRMNHFYWHKEEKEVAYNIEELEEEWKKTKIFDKWSNIYNVSAIPAKIRSVGGEKYIAANLKVLAEVEHNRWNMEKLLMGFRPTTDEEHKLVKADAKKKNEYKDRFIHDDIRPFSELDDAMKEIDRKLIEHIPDIMRQ